jgi:hypothetical protein
MSVRASLADHARLREHNYKVEAFTGRGGGYVLLDFNDPIDPEGDALGIGGHGCIAPTQWEAVAEGLKRIEQDQDAEAAFARGCAERAGIA